MSDRTRVFNCDCLPAMKGFPDKHFDLAIVDPPYGIEDEISIGGGSHTKSGVKFHQLYSENGKKWDVRPGIEYFKELIRVSQNQIVCGGNYFSDILPVSRGWAVYDKVTDGMTCVNPELIYTSFHKACSIFRRAQGLNNGFLNKEGGNIHPTQKPVALYKWLLKNYAKEGDKILDSHGGSMSSVIACLDMGFSITCYELDPDYYNAGKNRIINHLKQLNAFRPAYDIEFHDNNGVSELRNNAGIGYQEQKDGANNNPIYRIDGLFHGDPSQSDIQTPKAS